MDQDTLQAIEEELVISKATSHPEESAFTYEEDGRLRLSDGAIVANTMTPDFLGFGRERRVLGNYYCGQSAALRRLQDSISRFLKSEDSLVFGSYEALCADIMESLLNTGDAIIYDSAISLPMRRGIKSCQADKMRFPHGDMIKLEEQLKLSVMKRIRVILTDGIFFDSGDCAQLKDIRQLAQEYGAMVIIDDSYGFLTCGKNGRGADEHCGVAGFQDLKIVNMQNALCCASGGFASGNRSLIQLLKLRSRCYRHSMSVSESDAAMAEEIISQISSDTSRIEAMHARAAALCERLRKMGYQCAKPAAGIVSFVSESSAEKIKGELRSAGLVAQYSKVGRCTLASLKVSANYDYHYNLI